MPCLYPEHYSAKPARIDRCASTQVDATRQSQARARALSTCRFSISRPSSVATPAPSRAACSNASITRRACSTSAPTARRRGCRSRSAPDGSASCRRIRAAAPERTLPRSPPVADVVVDAIEDRRARSHARRADTARGSTCSGSRPGIASARSSLSRSLVPITSDAQPLARGRDLGGVQHGRGRFEHRPDLRPHGRARALERAARPRAHRRRCRPSARRSRPVRRRPRRPGLQRATRSRSR